MADAELTVTVTIDAATLLPFVELLDAATEYYERPFNDDARERLGAALAAIGAA
jgi:hypothetical protein